MCPDPDVLPRAFSLAVHELRTPVTVISGYLRMLLREQAGPITDMQRKMLEDADRSCSRINALVSEMSDFGKLESGELAVARVDLDLAALLNEVAKDMHEGSDRGVRLEIRGADKPLIVTGDRVRLAAALRALMHAALRERGEPGTVVVSCTVTGDGDARSVIVAVGDDSVLPVLTGGNGQAPFDEWRGGLGLALPVGRRVVEAHGGAIWSAPGDAQRRGSAIRLPLSSRAQDQ